ncbi:MAG: PorV/PorQ family protein [Candidatus Marinimicrobia bacterium]|nr:PorV/PorQ family protein [Candidatus Neomarinimicrobiota bacterium]
MLKKLNITLIVIALFFLTSLSAEEFAPVGTAVAQFMEIGLGARATGMGEAFTALANDAGAVFWNPAGLADAGKRSLFSAYNTWPAGISIGGLSMAMNLGNLGTIAVSSVYLMTDDMEITTIGRPEGTGEYFNISNYSLGLTYARYLTDKVSVGLTTKLVHEGYWDYSYSTWAIDMGTMYRTGFHGLNIAMSILHFGPEINFSGDYVDYSDPKSYDAQPDPLPKTFEKYSLPVNFRFGISFDVLKTNMHRLTTAMDMIHPNNNLEQYNMGLEYGLKDMLFLRGGYKFSADEGGLCLGGGTSLSLTGDLKIIADYSFADMGALKSIHRFSLGIDF